jgi:hypothetical protein
MRQLHAFIALLTIPTVVARFRPQNKIELASGGEPIVAFQSEDTCSIQVRFLQRMVESCQHQANMLMLHSRARPMPPSPLIVSLT